MKSPAFAALVLVPFLFSCDSRSTAPAPPPAAARPHRHRAPHGGTLVELGDESAHLELVFDPATAELAAFVLDGEVERPVRVKQSEIILHITVVRATDSFPLDLVLPAIANPLTGETIGDTSEFRANVPQLAGNTSFSAVIRSIEVRGRVFSDLHFAFPNGATAAGH